MESTFLSVKLVSEDFTHKLPQQGLNLRHCGLMDRSACTPLNSHTLYQLSYRGI